MSGSARKVIGRTSDNPSLFVGMVLLSALVVGGSPARAGARGVAAEDNSRVAWLGQHAIRLRSIDPNDEDFSDLQPLAKILQGARIVQLGEQTHGDGATFHAKARLIKFLHRDLGFDVLAFESGLYDCRKVWEFLRGGMEPYEAFQHGVFGIWSRSEQFRPVIEYAGKVAKSERPLELCGFDCQYTGKASRDLLPQDIATLWDELGTNAPEASQRVVIMEALPRLARWEGPSPAERDGWHDAFLAWHEALEKARPSATLGTADLAFWRQFVASTRAFVKMCQCGPDASGRRGNLRDAQMGGNLIWLARTAYPQRKIIVWAASSHLVRSMLPSWVEEYDLKTRMGCEVWKALGEETYTVGFTAAEGCWSRWFDQRPRPLPPPAAGSLEDLFVRAGYSNAFLDFRGRGPGGVWLEQKLTARPFGYVNHETNWTEMFDAIVFTRNMYGSTRCASN